jgi:hypothetical protein
MLDPIKKWDEMPRDVKLDLIKPYIESGMPEDYLDMHLGNLPIEMRTAVEDYLSNAGAEDISNPDEYNAFDSDDEFLGMDTSMGDMDLGDPYGDDLYEYSDLEDGIHESPKKKTKYTRNELKEAIRQEIIASLTEDGELDEAKKKKKDDEEADIELDAETEDIPLDGEDGGDMGDMDLGDIGGDVTSGAGTEDVQSNLMAALKAAKGMGDKKLVRQIGNALTYFTRQQVSSDEESI